MFSNHEAILIIVALVILAILGIFYVRRKQEKSSEVKTPRENPASVNQLRNYILSRDVATLVYTNLADLVSTDTIIRLNGAEIEILQRVYWLGDRGKLPANFWLYINLTVSQFSDTFGPSEDAIRGYVGMFLTFWYHQARASLLTITEDQAKQLTTMRMLPYKVERALQLMSA